MTGSASSISDGFSSSSISSLGSAQDKRNLPTILELHWKIPAQSHSSPDSQKLKGTVHSTSPDKKLSDKIKQVAQVKVLKGNSKLKSPTIISSPYQKKQSLKVEDKESDAQASLSPYRASFCSIDETKRKGVSGKRSIESKPLLSTTKNSCSDESLSYKKIETVRSQVVQISTPPTSRGPRFESPVKKIDSYFRKLRAEIAQDSVQANTINQAALDLLKQGLTAISQEYRENGNEAVAAVKGWGLAQEIEKQRKSEINKLNNIGLPRPSKEYSTLMDDALTGEFIEK